jgi:hypothetical protein
MGQSVGRAGHRLADLLLARLQGTPEQELQEIWPVELIRRGSDAPPPASARATGPGKKAHQRPSQRVVGRLRAVGE